MCGIAGKLHLDRSRPVENTEIEQMIRVMRHRGPDGEGVFVDGPVGLGHLRLSIIDLVAGGQPMANEDRTVWIVFNGEIYNHAELRERLLARGHRFSTRSDTEVIVHLYEELGEECVRELRGMFAFAIWDAPRQKLFLARDRVGIKPLYFCESKGSLWFASEIKALLTSVEVPREVNRQAIGAFLAHYYLPGEETLFENVRRLLPGHTLTVEDGAVKIRQYWDLRFMEPQCRLSFEDAAAQLRELLHRRVCDHMISDVPVGFLASGGVDSTALLCIAARQTGRQLQTFTVGFDNEHFADERPFARMAAECCGTRHHEITVSAEEFRDFLPSYVWHMEDPVCEPPAVALHFVSKLARGHVKVLLSGEGGDEAFGGYSTYRNQLLAVRMKRFSGPLSGPLGRMIEIASKVPGLQRLDYLGKRLGTELHSHYWSRTSSPWHRFNSESSIYAAEFLQTAAPGAWTEYVTRLHANAGGNAPLGRMLYVDTKSWLPDDLLIKADKMTMGNSIELRVPLLDHEVLEFAARLPSAYKVRGTELKRVLKRAFRDVVPSAILNRKKTGFPVPYERWLRGELRSFVRETLCSERARSRGYFNPRAVSRLIEENETRGTLSKEIFSLLTLELWHQGFLDAARPGSHSAEMKHPAGGLHLAGV